MHGHRAYLRRILAVGAITVLMIGGVALSTRADDEKMSESQVIQSELPTVVNIHVKKVERVTSPDAKGPANSASKGATVIKGYVGSGFIIDPSGLIVTNYHVVDGAYQIVVTLSDGTHLDGKMTTASRLVDLALVQVHADHPLPAAHWGNSDTLEVGDPVLAAGNPFGLGLSLASGIVSALNRDIQNSPYDDLIQTDALLNHGNSGGPLFDRKGDVIGVNSTIISPTTGSAGLSFAIPANGAHFVVNQLRTYGWVHPGWIGVRVQTMTDDMANALRLPQPEGSVVSWVLPDSPAMKAGLRIGDVILEFNGAKPGDERALLRDIARSPTGASTTMVVLRDGKQVKLPITVDVWPRSQWEVLDSPAEILQPSMPMLPHLGLTLAPITTAAEKTKLGLAANTDGVLVTKVLAESDLAYQGIQSGDVILRVQNNPVATPAAFWTDIDAARADKRYFVMLLVFPKVRTILGAKWVAARVAQMDKMTMAK
jgi:serine protease Do